MKQKLLAFGALSLLLTGTVAAEALTVTPAAGGDITTALTTALAGATDKSDVVITLAADGNYTVSGSLEVPGALTINGNGATIDASALTAPFVQMSATPAVEKGANDFYTIGNVAFNNVNVTGLSQQLFYANKTKYYIPTLTTDGCDIQYTGGNKNVYDFNAGGVVGTLDIKNSTISSYPANTGFFYTSQGGNKATEVDPDITQTFSITNSTLYNLANGKNVCNHRQNGQTWLKYVVKNSILINCGKKGQFVQGLNGGQSSKNPTYDVDTNSFLWGTPGDFAVQPENEPAEGLFQNTLGEPTSTFPKADEGIFTLNVWSSQAKAQVGAPKWLVAYDATAPAPIFLNPADGADLTTALAEAMPDPTKALKVTINLAANASYTVSGSLNVATAIVINGNGATIDASALTAPFVQMSATPAVEKGENDFYTIGNVAFNNVNVNGLSQQLFYANKIKYYIPTLTTDGCDIQIAGGNKTVYDFNGGGVVGTLDIKNSTISAYPANTGALFSSQSGQKVIDVNADLIQTFSITNSTLYNIAYNKNVSTHRQANQKHLAYVVKDNVIINCGKKDQFVKGLNQGQGGTNPSYTVENNSFLWGTPGDFAVTQESEPADGTILNSVGEPTSTFSEANEGIFTLDEWSAQAQAQVGAKKWLVPYVAPTNIPEDAELSAFVKENIVDGSKNTVTFMLAPGATYQLADTADLKIANVAFQGNAGNRPVINITGNGTFLTQRGVQFTGVDFDMTNAPMTAVVMLSADPDSCYSTKYLGLKALSDAVKDGFVLEDPISFKSCNFKNLPSRLFMSGTKDWAVRQFDIIDCVMQFNKKDGNAVISFEEAWSGVNGIKDLTIKNSTFYNTGETVKARFIRYGNKNNAKPTAIFGPNATSKHLVEGCTFYQTFNGNKFANNMPEVKEFTVELNSSILYNIDRPDEYFSRSGKITCVSDSCNMAWLAGDENGTNIRQELQAISIVENPEFAGPVNRVFNLSEVFGGVNFRPMNETAITKKIGDPRWFTAPAGVPVIAVPDGAELSKFVTDTIVDGSKAYYQFSLAPGATYELTDTANLKIADVAFVGFDTTRPVVKISGNGTFLSQNGISFKDINFDMTEAPVTSFITITATPDSCFSTKYLGLKELSSSVKDGFIYENPIAIESCDFKDLPGSIIYTAQINDGTSGWGFKNISIVNSVVQFNKQNDAAAISLEWNWGVSGIANMKLANSTFYNLANYKARFLRYGARTKPEQIFGPGATTKHTFSHCTFSKTFTDNQFANNMDNSGLEATIDHCIFYDINRLDQYCFRSGTSQTSSDNISWLAGNEESVHGNVAKMSEIENPDFVGPIDLPYDFALEFGGVNFRPLNENAVSKKIGDPRWFNASAEIAPIDVPDGTELSAFVKANVPAYSQRSMTFNLAAGGSYTLVGSADTKMANVTFAGAETPAKVTISDEGAFVTQNGLILKDLNFDMTDAQASSFIKLTQHPDSCFSTKGLGLLAADSTGTVREGFVMYSPIEIEGCAFRNIPNSVLSNDSAAWAVETFIVNNSVLQFNKKGSSAVIDFSTPAINDKGEIIDWAHFGQVKNLTLENSTFYNLTNATARFIRYANKSNSTPAKAFGVGARALHVIDGCTMYRTFSHKEFANNTPQSDKMTIEVKNTILYDISRLDKYFQGCNVDKEVSTNNMAWLAGYDDDGKEQEMRSAVELIAYIEDPQFVGPTDRAYDFAEEFGGVNFRPLNATAEEKKIGDPRWFEASTETGINNVAADEEIVNGPVEYFNLQGIRVAADKLVPGIYVKRQGNKAEKVYVK